MCQLIFPIYLFGVDSFCDRWTCNIDTCNKRPVESPSLCWNRFLLNQDSSSYVMVKLLLRYIYVFTSQKWSSLRILRKNRSSVSWASWYLSELTHHLFPTLRNSLRSDQGGEWPPFVRKSICFHCVQTTLPWCRTISEIYTVCRWSRKIVRFGNALVS